MPTFSVQFDYNGRHRILVQDGTISVGGAWAGYRHLSTLTYRGKTYIAGTEYGLLPKAETVYEVRPQVTLVDHSMEQVDTQLC